MRPVALSVPHLYQPTTGDCLPACVAMVLGYWQIAYSLDHLSRLLEVIPGVGAPAFNVRNLERLGLRVEYHQGTLRVLHAHLESRCPPIVFVKTGELPYWDFDVNHAVVLTGMDGARVLVNDPFFTKTPISIPLGDFDLAWLEHNEMYTVITR